MVLLLIEEDFDELENKEKKIPRKKKSQENCECTCGRVVCCGKHKKGKCSCQQNQKERE